MILFTEDMKTGIPHIDAQHNSLVDFANQATALCDLGASHAAMKAQLDFLGEYVARHFLDEEQLQEESKYPRYRMHRAIHLEFARTFESICVEFEKYGVSEELSKTLTSRVSNWIVTHIKMEDAAFGKYYMQTKRKLLQGHV